MCLKRLLRHKVDVDAQPPSGPSGWTPLHLVTALGDETMLQVLIEHGADLELQNEDGKTSLALGCSGVWFPPRTRSSSHLHCVASLIEAGAKLCIKDDCVKGPIDHLQSQCWLFEQRKGTGQLGNESVRIARKWIECLKTMWAPFGKGQLIKLIRNAAEDLACQGKQQE